METKILQGFNSGQCAKWKVIVGKTPRFALHAAFSPQQGSLQLNYSVQTKGPKSFIFKWDEQLLENLNTPDFSLLPTSVFLGSLVLDRGMQDLPVPSSSYCKGWQKPGLRYPNCWTSSVPSEMEQGHCCFFCWLFRQARAHLCIWTHQGKTH